MEFTQEKRSLSEAAADLAIVIVFQDESISDALKALDPGISAEFVQHVIDECTAQHFAGKAGESVLLPTFGNLPVKRLFLRGIGKKAEANAVALRKAAAASAKRLLPGTAFDTVVFYPRVQCDAGTVQGLVEGWILGGYQFKKYKGKDDGGKRADPKQFAISGSDIDGNAFHEAVSRAKAIAEATCFARDMIAEPPSVMTPTRLAELAKSIAGNGYSCEVLDRAAAEKLGMGSFLGVAQGATEPPQFIVMRYKSPQAKKTIGIAGKGITFDSGGLSIKSAQSMENMKYDMSGAAATIATMKAIAELQPAINVVAVAAATENMPGPTAIHPGDILRALNGKTIEVNNTDAEGRLVLADALCYLQKEKPDELIDIATLTGAAVTALGRAAAAIMGNDDKLVQQLIDSASSAGEKLWQLPLFDEYKDYLKSEVADLKNAGARGEAGSSAGGMFLKEFVDGKPWVHLDIAGPGWIEKDKDELNKGGTAFGVRTLCYYLLSQAQ